MFKSFKKLAAVSLAAVSLFSVTAACGGNNSTVNINTEQTQLNVGVFDAGLGTVYFDEMAKDFEEYYKDYSFEEGKKGVQVVPFKKKEEFTPGNLVTQMQNYDNAIWFLDQGNYNEFVNKGLLADITDTVTEKVYDAEGNLAAKSGKTAVSSIEDMMIDGYSDIFRFSNSSVTERYYAVPFWISIPGIIYDAALFDERGFYFKKNGSIGARQADIDSGNCSAGPDGKLGTLDDGLPATWNDFVTLMNHMIKNDVTPFTWSATHTYQRSGVYTQMWANYEGYDNFILNYSFNGHDSGLNLDITESNFTELKNQEGRKAAIKAFYDITKNRSFYSVNAAVGNNHTDAESEFITSHQTDKPIAMFMENSYWESESREVFNALGQADSDYAFGNHDYRFMPVPRFVGTEGVKDQTNTGRVIVGRGADNYICLSARNKCSNPEVQLKVAKMLLQFVHTREQLVQFTSNTGCFRSFKYTANEEELKTYTKYTQSIANYIAEEGTVLTSNIPLSSVRKNAGQQFDEENYAFAFMAAQGNDIPLFDPFKYFYKYTNATVEQCFEDAKNGLQNQFAKFLKK